MSSYSAIKIWKVSTNTLRMPNLELKSLPHVKIFNFYTLDMFKK